MPLARDIVRRAEARREEGRSWASIARELEVHVTTLRYNVDADFKERMKKAQRARTKRSKADSPWRDGYKPKKKGPKKGTPRSGAKAGSPTPPADDKERRARADELANTSLAERIEARVAARVGPMRRIKDA